MEERFDERPVDEAGRRYKNLYDTTDRKYKDFQQTTNSWKEIAETLGKDAQFYKTRWKYMRDRFVKAKNKMKGKSGDGANLRSLDSGRKWQSHARIVGNVVNGHEKCRKLVRGATLDCETSNVCVQGSRSPRGGCSAHSTPDYAEALSECKHTWKWIATICCWNKCTAPYVFKL